MPRGNQLTRQWHLLQLLDRPAGIAVDDASRDLDCAVRTIWRDLRVLQDAGFPIYDEQGADTLEVRRWILGFGAEAKVLEPSALREALRRDAEALAQKLAPQRVPPASMPLGGGTAPLRAARPPS